MWLFTTRGFFSVVAHRDRTDMLLIRARSRDELEQLIQGYGIAARVQSTPRADYPFRIEIPREIFATQVLPLLSMDINYDNFKDACAQRHPDPEYSHGLLMSIWSSARRFYVSRRAEEKTGRAPVPR